MVSLLLLVGTAFFVIVGFVVLGAAFAQIRTTRTADQKDYTRSYDWTQK